jgi:hypothetical protein
MNQDKISPFDNIKSSNPENIVQRPSIDNEDLTYENEQWLMGRMRSRMGEPNRPFRIEIPYREPAQADDVPDKDGAGIGRRIKGD